MSTQCKKCPWKATTNPCEIPNGYDEAKHKALANTIAEPGVLSAKPLRIMGCHEFALGAEQPCIGWLANQLGFGNNVALRLAALKGTIDTNCKLVGPQHERFEDTLP